TAWQVRLLSPLMLPLPTTHLAACPPSADTLQLCGQRDEQRLRIGRAHQLHTDRKPVAGETGWHVDRRPAQYIPRPGHGATRDHGAVGGPPAEVVERVHIGWRLRGGRG